MEYDSKNLKAIDLLVIIISYYLELYGAFGCYPLLSEKEMNARLCSS